MDVVVKMSEKSLNLFLNLKKVSVIPQRIFILRKTKDVRADPAQRAGSHSCRLSLRLGNSPALKRS